MRKNFKFPLMRNNISRDDLNKLINYLKKPNPYLTQGKKVKKFEKLWSKWLGVKYSVFVNSGSSANLLSLALLKIKFPMGGEVIVPPLTWISDIASVLQAGFKPIFCDINLHNLGMNEKEIEKKITKRTRAIFLSHIQGFNALTDKMLQIIKKKRIFLIEDVCESHGASFRNKKLGSFGWTSNFSFYYAHHLTTIEGGMVCTNSKEAYQILLKLRSHGLARESNDISEKKKTIKKYKNLNSDFIFQYAAYNVRNTELGAILGINQLKKLNQNIKKRNRNNKYFLSNLDSRLFYTEFDLSGSSNYAFNLILKPKYARYVEKLKTIFKKNSIEFRQGSAGGGNQLRQPYLYKVVPRNFYKKFKNTEYIHKFGFYIGNFPELSIQEVNKICLIANSLKKHI